LQHPDYMRHTATGAALLRFVAAYATPAGARLPPAPDVDNLSAGVQRALIADLRARRPAARVKFDGGQQSASEALVHLLDMLEPPPTPGEEPQPCPINQLFLHRYRLRQHCATCR